MLIYVCARKYAECLSRELHSFYGQRVNRHVYREYGKENDKARGTTAESESLRDYSLDL